MDNFIGKWEQFDEPIENIDAFLEAAGVSDETVNIKGTRVLVEYQKDGEGYKSIFTDMNSDKVKEYCFKIGVPFDSIDLHGKNFKAIINVENPNKMKESYSEWSESEIIITREIEGDILKMTMTVKDVSASCRAKRV